MMRRGFTGFVCFGLSCWLGSCGFLRIGDEANLKTPEDSGLDSSASPSVLAVYPITGPTQAKVAECAGPYQVSHSPNLPKVLRLFSSNKGKFFSDSNCQTAVFNLSSQSSLKFYYKQTTVGNSKLVASNQEEPSDLSTALQVRVQYTGIIDQSFAANGVAIHAMDNFFDQVLDLAVLGDGSILAAGYMNHAEHSDFALFKLTPEGTPDGNFGNAGKVLTDFFGFDDIGKSVAVDSNGNIYLGGSARTTAESRSDFAIAKYLPNGSLDNSFGSGGKLLIAFGENSADYANSLIIDSSDSLLLAGHTNQAGNSDFAIVKVSSSGTLDPNFGSNGRLIIAISRSNNDVVHDIAIAADGKFLVGGYVFDGSTANFALARFDSQGRLDPRFGNQGQVVSDWGGEEVIHGIEVTPNGKIAVAGLGHNGADADFAIARYNAQGKLDRSFGKAGLSLIAVGSRDEEAFDLLALADGRLLVGGQSYSGTDKKFDFALVQLLPNGELDTEFARGGKLVLDLNGAQGNDHAHALSRQKSGRILLAGTRIGDLDTSGNSVGSQYDFAISALR